MENTVKLDSFSETSYIIQASILGLQLRMERKRLGLNQVEFGAYCGVTSRTVIEWEKGNSAPDLYQLHTLSIHGLDLAKFNYESPEKITMEHYAFKEILFAESGDGNHAQAMKVMSINLYENPKYTLINVESIFNENGDQTGIRYFYKYPELLTYDESHVVRQSFMDSTINDIRNNRYINKG